MDLDVGAGVNHQETLTAVESSGQARHKWDIHLGTIHLDSVLVADENLLLNDVEVDLAQLSGTL